MIIGFIVVRGIGGITATFFTQDLATTGTLDSGGGLAHALVGTLEQVAIAVVISVPLGVMTAVFLNEVKGPLVRPVRIFVDAMSGVPSIVAGLFIYAVWIVQFGHGFSGFAASLALAVLMLPTITRTAEEVLRLSGSKSEIAWVPYAQAYEAGFEDMPRRVPDLSRIHGLIGWAPTISLSEILTDVIAHERGRA